ncbi:hypothetical protein [Phytohabitans aurantiacus]|uniref:Uncharacterized protein n=1 Tax=Phytohabitans aurantiacus TaxID=3016789 RepID=A0ABQ5QKV5_9ACTN|nr:hypothetical protein [Phytohabitans aurantiacus]GLH94884.1 hypothetical protein Pa4123_01560 [Phytohabitans aurantiacus]
MDWSRLAPWGRRRRARQAVRRSIEAAQAAQAAEQQAARMRVIAQAHVDPPHGRNEPAVLMTPGQQHRGNGGTRWPR